MKNHLLLFAAAAFLTSCSSTPEKQSPDWTKQPTRTVDNGYIVYVGISTDPSADRARFKAEGMALEDLANECSLVPKGARIEDRYVQSEKYQNTAYVKLALEFQECEEAKRAVDPSEIKKLASLGFTDQLKKYQDLTETGEMPESGQVAAIQPPAEPTPAPVRQPGWNDNTMFIATRQYVAYQKEVVILAPPTAYPVGSPQATSFTNQIQAPTQSIATTSQMNPAVMKTPLSSLPNREAIASSRPPALAPAHPSGFHSLQAPHAPGQMRRAPPGRERRRGRKRGYSRE